MHVEGALCKTACVCACAQGTREVTTTLLLPLWGSGGTCRKLALVIYVCVCVCGAPSPRFFQECAFARGSVGRACVLCLPPAQHPWGGRRRRRRRVRRGVDQCVAAGGASVGVRACVCEPV